jgi:hypothetical protein
LKIRIQCKGVEWNIRNRDPENLFQEKKGEN